MKNNSLFNKIAVLLISLYLIIPLFMTVVYSLFRDFTSMIPKGFTLDFYKGLFVGGSNILSILGRTLFISILPVLITMTIMLLAIYGMKVYFPKADRILDAITKIPYGIQGVIMAVSLIFLYTSMSGFIGDRVFILIAAYCVIISPYMYQGAKNALSTIELMPILEAGQVLGASNFRTYVTVIIPSVYRGLLANMLLCAGILFGDFVLVNIIAGSYFPTLGIYLNEVRSKSGPTAAAISTLMSILMIGLSMFVNYLNRSQIEKKEEVK